GRAREAELRGEPRRGELHLPQGLAALSPLPPRQRAVAGVGRPGGILQRDPAYEPAGRVRCGLPGLPADPAAQPDVRESRKPDALLIVQAHGPKGGMSLLGFRGKLGARFSKNDLMPSCASAPAARYPTHCRSRVTASIGS